jgi:hypothetical protein
MSRQEDSMASFDKIMHALLAVPKEEALKTMKKTIADKKKKRGRPKARAK